MNRAASGIGRWNFIFGGVLLLALFASARVADADALTCERTIATASTLFAQTEHKVLQSCVKARRKAGDAPAGTLAACKADPKIAAKLVKATANLTAAIDRQCGGKDKQCGGDLTNEIMPISIGWPTACPNFQDGLCANQIFDCNDITSCVRCIDEAAVDQIITEDYETFLNQPPTTNENKCQVGLSAAILGFFNDKSAALHRCWDAVMKGKSGFSAPCPAGDASGKTLAAIKRAEAKKIRAICAACGGGGDKNRDGVCDKTGFDPQTQIGFGSTCPLLHVPGGPDCGAIGAITTLQKYIECIDCVTEFKVDCVDRNAVLGEAPYPGECNPLATITLSGAAVGKNLEVATAGSLGVPAPAGNLQVTMTSADPSRLLLSTSPTAAGSASIALTVGAGSSTIPTFYVQGLVATGSVGVTASASGYSTGPATFTLQPSGFVLGTTDFTTTSFSSNTGLGVYAAMLDPTTLAYVGYQALRGGLTVNVPVMSGSPGVGTIAGSPAVFNGGDSYNTATAFHPVAPGTSTLSLGPPSSGGFSTPSNYQQLTGTVTAPHIYLSSYYCYDRPSNFTVGLDLEVPIYVCLDAAPPSAMTITVTSGDGAVGTLSTDATLAGGSSAALSGVSGSGFVGTLFLQGRSLAGTTLTVQAPGYTDGTASVTVNPSGFVLGTGDFTTTSYSPDTALAVYTAVLDPTTLADVGNQALRGGLTVNVPVMSGSPGVGTIAGSPAVFNGGDSYNVGTAFHPVALGTSTLSLGAPSGGVFSTPSNYQQLTATVTAPHIYLSNYYCAGYSITNTFTVGLDLEVPVYVCLDAPPPSSMTITVTSGDATLGTLSTDPTLAGAGSAGLSGVTGSGLVGAVYLQGRGLGNTTLTVQAPGYTDGTASVTVNPSGFVLGTGDFTTTSYSPDTALAVYTAVLDPTTLADVGNQALRGGLTVNVPVMSGSPGVGTIAGSPAVFNGGDSYNVGTAFHPVALGTSTLSLGAPSGGVFSTPSNYQQLTATVTAPHIYLSNYYCYSGPSFTVGLDLEVPVYVCLDAAPPSATTITVTSGDATLGTLSTDPTLAGAASASLSGVTSGGFVGTVYLQGRGLGNPTLTAHASGYADATSSFTVDPAGFVTFQGDFSTTTSSSDTSIGVYSARLDPITLNYAELQRIRGGLTVDVAVNSENTGVGAITGSPAVFNGGDSFNSTTAFHPVGPGTSSVSVSLLSGGDFSIPSNYRGFTVTVTP